MRQPTYGEIAFQTWHKIWGQTLLQWDEQSEQEQEAWENTAAAVIAAYHKRQIELGRQTKK
jgi:hypothetical protein